MKKCLQHPECHNASLFWGGLLFVLLLLKLLGLVIDPQPQFFLGDSVSYIHTALTDWVPVDRSYWYGVVIRKIVGTSESLAPLLIAQALMGVATAWLAAYWAYLVFRPGSLILFMVGVFCVLDPIQLLFERYVMTESIALFFLSLMLVGLALVICRGRWIWMIFSVLAAVAVVALRISLLPVVLVTIFITPALGLFARSLKVRQAFLALGVAMLALLPILHLTLKIKNSQAVVAAWSPLLTSRDFPDAAQGERFLSGLDLVGGGIFAREIHLFRSDGLIQRVKTEVPDLAIRETLLHETALRLARRDPWGIVALGWNTYVSMWNFDNRFRLMQWDVGQNPLDDEFRAILAKEFHFAADPLPHPTLSSRIYLSVEIWIAIALLVAPVLLGISSISRKRQQIASLMLLIAGSAAVIMTVSIFSTMPVVRYLHPLGWMLLAGGLPVLFGLFSHLPGFFVRRREIN